MIISRTPFRISFFGGGTDYPVWYRENGGAVLSTTIDKYCYISCRYLPPFFEHKYRVSYSRIDMVREIEEIGHPAVKEVFKFMNIEEGVEVHHDGDLPARTGLGSSSAFTVGLIHSLYALKGEMVTKGQLAKDAIYVEQELIKENVGSQDQVATAYGGFNRISFLHDHSIDVRPLIMSSERQNKLQNNLMLCFTGFSRCASDIAKEQLKRTQEKKKELSKMHQMVDEAISILNSDSTNIEEFGKLLHESWKLKRSLTDKISNSKVDEIYDTAYSSGASGGKLLGAGGGGFMIIFARPEIQQKIRKKLKDLLIVPFQFETMGSQIIVYQPNQTYSINESDA
jgi:D-glycero-alpha-D-manno-heptose-7-phosphate kinase|tara:strand:- start:1147 stop:2166 length:1020 start_codon:yes stop_codon:yes gene_type:complete